MVSNFDTFIDTIHFEKGGEEILKTKNELNTIFSGLNGSRRVLHLYTPKVDKYLIHKAFLSEGNGRSVYITNEDSEIVRGKLQSPNLKVLQPTNRNNILNCKKVLIDGASIREEDLAECEKQLTLGQSVLCTFDISKLVPEKIRELAEKHEKLILTTDSTILVSSKSLLEKDFSNKQIINEFVKKELKIIVLALLLGNPMCGTDIKKKIFEKFNILLSSGTLYPLLHELEEQKLLTCRYGIKTKTYEPTDKKKIEATLREHIEVKDLLNNFLQTAIEGG